MALYSIIRVSANSKTTAQDITVKISYLTGNLSIPL